MPKAAGARRADWNTANPDANGAFEAYRAQVLRHVEEEQQEFAAFVERLRFARDRSEFEQFMAERQPGPG